MGRLRKARLFATIGLLLPVLIGSTSYLFAWRALPQVTGTLQASGLQAPVEIIRDRYGVPHIYAANDADLFFAQGWVTAQDRAFQIEIFRRAGRGILSEVFGKTTVETDLLMRTLGLFRTAQIEAELLDGPAREAIDAYARGVNAYFDASRDRLPIEFTLLGIQPGRWEPVDSIAFGKVMAWELAGNWRYELLRSAFHARFGDEATAELVPLYPADGPVIVSESQVDPLQAISLLALHERTQDTLGFGGEAVGSNNWVASGTRTATGAPLLANDPHLGIRMPSIWYEVHLQAPRFDVAGASLPGAPGVIIGHNQSIAWGVTNLGADVQDLYVERLNPDNPRQYLSGDRWEDFDIRREEILVKGEPEPIIREILVSRHGPLLNAVTKGLGQPLALRWTALIPNRMTDSVLRLNRASNWTQFREALREFAVPGQNFVYADKSGNIGYQMTGLVPIRAKGNGLAPAPGWSGDYEWTDFIPFEALPSLFNPPAGLIATANNRVIGDDYPYLISSEWAPDFRVRRILDLLDEREKLSIADYKRVQNDIYSIPGRRIAEHLVKLQPWDERSRRAIEVLRRWDGNLTADSAAGAIVEVFYQRFIENAFAGPLGPDLWERYQALTYVNAPAMLSLLERPNSPWFTTVRTVASPGVVEITRESLKQTLDVLGKRLGDGPENWRWGKLHTATFPHPLGQVWPLDLFFNLGPLERPGSTFTVNAAGYNPVKGSTQVNVPSLRFIADLADFDNSLFVITTGQSGQILSPHLSDQTRLWERGDYHPMPFTRPAVESAAAARLTLRP